MGRIGETVVKQAAEVCRISVFFQSAFPALHRDRYLLGARHGSRLHIRRRSTGVTTPATPYITTFSTSSPGRFLNPGRRNLT
jgi:hypothetical protein